MPGLFALKYRTGKSLGSASLMADSKQTLACAMLSVALLIGLGLNYWFGLWQADPVIGLVIVALLIREGHHTLKEEKLCSCASCGLLPPAPDGLIFLRLPVKRPRPFSANTLGKYQDSSPVKLGKSQMSLLSRR